MTIHSPRMPLIALSALAVIVAQGCSDSGGSSDGLQSGDGYSVQGALAEIPASAVGDDLLIQTGDLAAASELVGVGRPEEATVDAVVPWVNALTGLAVEEGEEMPPLFVPLADVFNYQRLVEIAEFDDALGWSLVDADAFVEQAIPPDSLAVVAGEFDDDTLSDDLVAVNDDVVSFGDGEDHEVGEPNAVSPIGAPLRLANDGDRIAASRSTPVVESWVAGDEETLADDESLAAVAGALDDADAVAAVLTRVPGGIDPAQVVLGENASPEQIEQIAEQLEGQLPEDPYDVVGIGWAVDEGEAVISVAYHFASDEAATAAVEPLGALYGEGVSLMTNTSFSERMTVGDVTAEGSVAVVSVSPTDEGRPMDLYNMLHQREPLFASR